MELLLNILILELSSAYGDVNPFLDRVGAWMILYDTYIQHTSQRITVSR